MKNVPDFLQLLDPARSYSPSLLGGKAFNLHYLLKSGFRIPKTFVIDVEAVAQLSEGALIFPEVLKGHLYAVRSSGTSEDGRKHSYAGMFDSYLNVPFEKLSESVFKCAASIQNSRSKVYASKLNIQSANDICVIVQEMVHADYSGVCFTAHPITQDRNLLIIELLPGLGDRLVGGEISPITICYSKETGRADVISLGDFKELDVVSLNLTSLAATFIDVEKSYGYPVDIEWGVEKGQLMLLQARPITSFQ